MDRKWLWAGLGLALLAVIGRLVPHAANVTPLYAVALLACACFPRRWAAAVPVGAMIVSDLLIGIDFSLVFTWSGMAVFVWLGYRLRGRASTVRIVCSSAAGSLLFYVWTNFGVWLTSGMYPWSAEGLVACYALALPFFRNSILGDLAFSGLLFAAYDYYRVRRRLRLPVAATA